MISTAPVCSKEIRCPPNIIPEIRSHVPSSMNKYLVVSAHDCVVQTEIVESFVAPNTRVGQ